MADAGSLGWPVDGEGGQPSIDVKGIVTMRLQRLHFNSIPAVRSLAISWPHSHRASFSGGAAAAWSVNGTFFDTALLLKMKLRTIIDILNGGDMSSCNNLFSSARCRGSGTSILWVRLNRRVGA